MGIAVRLFSSWGQWCLHVIGWFSGVAATYTRLDFSSADVTLTKLYGSWFPFSFVRLQEQLMGLRCRTLGLIPRTLEIDGATSIHVWLPKRHVQAAEKSNGQKSQKPAVLLLHGFGASAIWQWQGQLSLLCPHYDVYMPDLLFFGGSTTTARDRTEVFQAVCMKKLMKTLGVARYDVVGISYGGFVAYRLSTMDSSPVNRLVLTACGLLITPAEFNTVLGQGGDGIGGGGGDGIGEGGGGGGRGAGPASILLPTTPQGVWRLMRLAYYDPLPMPTFLLRDALQTLFVDGVGEKRELLDEIAKYIDSPQDTFVIPHQDTLLIWGEDDELFPLAIAKRMKKLFGGTTRLVVLPRTRHMCNAQQSRQYNRELLRFLQA